MIAGIVRGTLSGQARNKGLFPMDKHTPTCYPTFEVLCLDLACRLLCQGWEAIADIILLSFITMLSRKRDIDTGSS